MLDQGAFELEWADPVIGRFENVVGAADIGQVAVFIDGGDIAGMINIISSPCRWIAILILIALTLIALHQSGRPRPQSKTDFPLLDERTVRTAERDAIARQRPAHRAGLYFLARCIADQGCRLGLSVTVADSDAPGTLDPLDHLRIKRFAGADQFSNVDRPGGQIFLNQYPPHCRWRAKCCDATAHNRIEKAARAKAPLIENKHRGLGVPWREETAPCMFSPARRRDIEMQIARTKPEPVHCRQMPDGVALMTVQYEFWPRRRSGGEIKQKGIIRARLTLRSKARRRSVALFERSPALQLLADNNPRIIARQVGEFRCRFRIGDHVPNLSAREAVAKIVARQQRGCRHDHGAKLHRGQHAFPERRHIAEHEKYAIAPTYTDFAQRIGDLVRSLA